MSQACTEIHHTAQVCLRQGRVDAPRDSTRVTERTAADYSCFLGFFLSFALIVEREGTCEAAADLPVPASPRFSLASVKVQQQPGEGRGEEPMFN